MELEHCSLTNLAIANNTVSIVITGTIAKEINDEYDLNPKTGDTGYIFLYWYRNLPYGAHYY
jgi:Na+/H+ antiporter NhaC